MATTLDPELEAARAAGLLPDPLAVAAHQLGGPAPVAPQLLSVADQTHVADNTPSIAPAHPAMEIDPNNPGAVAPKPGAAADLPLPAGVPPESMADQAAQRAREIAALRVGPDTKTSGVSAGSAKKIRAAAGKMGEVDAAREDIVRRETQSNEEKANEIALDEEEKKLDLAAQEANAVVERARLTQEKDNLVTEGKRLRDAHAKDYERSLFESIGTARTWLGAISVGLGAFAANWNRTPNFAWQIMEKAMDAHASREKARLAKDRDEIERNRGDVKDANAAILDYDRITRPQQESALLKRAEQRRLALLARYGADEARINGDKMLQNIREGRITRDLEIEKALAQRVESDNSEQNKLKRQLALGQPGGKPLSEGERKAVGTINAALNSLKRGLDNTQELSKKDKAVFRKIENEARQMRESDPGKAWSSFNQISGNYYSQLSENGSRRLRSLENYFRDLERNTSGAVIGPAETMGHIAEAIEAGGIKYALDRARAFSPLAGMAEGRTAGAVDSFERGLGASAAPARAAANPAATRAKAIEALRASDLSPKERAALDWARANPADERAQEIIRTVGDKRAN